MFMAGMVAVGTAVAVDAPPAIKENPATPNAFRFDACFLHGIVRFLHALLICRSSVSFVPFALTPRKTISVVCQIINFLPNAGLQVCDK
jgi:hypothetical protein